MDRALGLSNMSYTTRTAKSLAWATVAGLDLRIILVMGATSQKTTFRPHGSLDNLSPAEFSALPCGTFNQPFVSWLGVRRIG